MNEHDLSVLLARFASASTVDDLARASDALLGGKLVNKARLDERFERGLRSCLDALGPGGSSSDRLKAISIAYRLGASSKPVMTRVRELARPHLKHELPPLELLTDGQDRYYASLSILDAEGEWVAAFAARGVAREETAETARTTLARRLFSSLSVADGLALVSTELGRLSFETEKPSESAAKRLRRVIAAIRPTLVAEAILPGDDLGNSLRTFFASAFSKSGPPAPGPVTNGLANECCALVFDILRTQLTVIADPTIYRSLTPVREWIDSKLWPRFVKRSAAASNVLGALESAIILLAKQRISDQSLLETLQMFFASRDDAAAVTAKLSANNSGLEPEIREWLARFGRVRSTAVLTSMIDAQEASSEPAIASLLVISDALREGVFVGDRQEFRDKPERDLVEKLVEEIFALASSRRLALRFRPGDVVEYSPTAHEMVGGHILGFSRARVIRPMVERRNPDGLVTVILKALVGPIGDNNG